jgi:hypothetical protein
VFNNSGAKRKGFLIATWLAVLLTALVGYWLMHRLQTNSVQSIQQSIDTWRLTFTLCRWTGIALVAFGWNIGVEHLAKTGKIHFDTGRSAYTGIAGAPSPGWSSLKGCWVRGWS